MPNGEQVLPQALGEPGERVLAACVSGVAERTHEAEHRRDVRDRARSLLHEVRQERSHDAHGPEVVYLQHRVEVGVAEALDVAGDRVSRVVDDDVDTAQRVERARRPVCDRRRRRHIHADSREARATSARGLAHLFERIGEPCFIARGDRDSGPGARELHRDGPPDAGRAAGHEDAFPREEPHARVLGASPTRRHQGRACHHRRNSEDVPTTKRRLEVDTAPAPVREPLVSS
jgi:hypothetical protein